MKSLYNGNIVGLGQTGSPLPQEALTYFLEAQDQVRERIPVAAA